MANSFGNLTDYFEVSGTQNENVLMLVGSYSGTQRKVTNLWNGAWESGSELANPVCTFKIKSSGTVNFTLGKAYSGNNGKYFLTDVEFKTGADIEPILILKGTANEGADAINQYTLAFNVSPMHITQEPYWAFTGGGDKIECNTVATCDPVVPYENNKPCASDIVHGRIVVTMTVNAYDGEARPTTVNNFIENGIPKTESDVDFMSYSLQAERSLPWN